MLPTWSAHFHGADFCRGTEVRLALSSGGGVATIIDGEKVRPNTRRTAPEAAQQYPPTHTAAQSPAWLHRMLIEGAWCRQPRWRCAALLPCLHSLRTCAAALVSRARCQVHSLRPCAQKGSVQSPQLAAALSEVYVGPFSVSPALEGDFLDTVAAVLQHSKPAAAPAAPEA